MPTRRLLNSWKEIAGYLRVSIRTAQKWESEAGLPIHRARRRGSAIAFSDEIDTWLKATKLNPDFSGDSKTAEISYGEIEQQLLLLSHKIHREVESTLEEIRNLLREEQKCSWQ